MSRYNLFSDDSIAFECTRDALCLARRPNESRLKESFAMNFVQFIQEYRIEDTNSAIRLFHCQCGDGDGDGDETSYIYKMCAIGLPHANDCIKVDLPNYFAIISPNNARLTFI